MKLFLREVILGGTLRPAYSCAMEGTVSSKSLFAILFGLVALVGLAGFGGWLATGDDLFMSLIQAGMRWCF